MIHARNSIYIYICMYSHARIHLKNALKNGERIVIDTGGNQSGNQQKIIGNQYGIPLLRTHATRSVNNVKQSSHETFRNEFR